VKEKESGEEREEEEEERELAKRECEAREKGTGEKMRARGSRPSRSICCRPARLDRHLHTGETGGKTGRGHGLNRSENQHKQTNSRVRGKRRSEKHISVQAGRGGG
jgi:hypothetical protein